MNDYNVHLRKLKTRGYASQALLDFVDKKGAVTHKELEIARIAISRFSAFTQ